MRIKKEKCALLLTSVEHLGHIISAGELHVSSKVRAMLVAPFPRDVTELRFFLDYSIIMASSYRILPQHSSPSYGLLQKKKWMWGQSQKEAFDKVGGGGSVEVIQNTNSL